MGPVRWYTLHGITRMELEITCTARWTAEMLIALDFVTLTPAFVFGTNPMSEIRGSYRGGSPDAAIMFFRRLAKV